MKSSSFLSVEQQQLSTIALLLGWSAALVAVRIHLSSAWRSDASSWGLGWNLFLATLPVLFAWAFERAMRKKRLLGGTCWFVLWLLFFPNAPYLLTDLIHLAPSPNVPLWFSLAMLLSCAGTGTLLGYFSLARIHRVVEAHQGRAAGWAVVIGSLALCGFGIYLGRFLRWNSWDAFTHPLRLSHDIVAHFSDPWPYPHQST